MKNRKRIGLINPTNKLYKKFHSITSPSINFKNLKRKKKRFGIQKIETENQTNLVYQPTVNYFNEYWEMYYENEYTIAKIKEIVYEINAIKAHLDEIKNYENK
jgi:hypothetical protein